MKLDVFREIMYFPMASNIGNKTKKSSLVSQGTFYNLIQEIFPIKKQ